MTDPVTATALRQRAEVLLLQAARQHLEQAPRSRVVASITFGMAMALMDAADWLEQPDGGPQPGDARTVRPCSRRPGACLASPAPIGPSRITLKHTASAGVAHTRPWAAI